MKEIARDLPFMLTVGVKSHLNTPRLIEGLIIAIVTASLPSYITVQQLEYRMEQVEKKVDRVIADIYKPVIPKE